MHRHDCTRVATAPRCVNPRTSSNESRSSTAHFMRRDGSTIAFWCRISATGTVTGLRSGLLQETVVLQPTSRIFGLSPKTEAQTPSACRTRPFGTCVKKDAHQAPPPRLHPEFVFANRARFHRLGPPLRHLGLSGQSIHSAHQGIEEKVGKRAITRPWHKKNLNSMAPPKRSCPVVEVGADNAYPIVRF